MFTTGSKLFIGATTLALLSTIAWGVLKGGDVGWTGAEFVAFRMHLPSKIRYHDAPSKQVERGKIEDDPEHPQIVLTVRGVGYKAGPA